MMVDRKKIVETYERIERAGGGVAATDTSVILSMAAIKLALPRETVRTVMIDHWTKGGAG